MDILLTNGDLTISGGSQTYVGALAAALDRRRHRISVYSPRPGWYGYDVISRHAIIVQRPLRPVDVVLMTHTTCLTAVPLGVPLVNICHGIVPPEEQPVAGATAYVAVSQEVQEHLRRLGHGSTVVHNGIDTSEYAPNRPLPVRLERVLFAGFYPEARPVVEAACRLLGVSLTVAQGTVRAPDMPGIYNEHDLVIGLGRCCYEAMACGRNVIVFGRHGGDGFVTEESLPDLLTHNCSGRKYRHPWGPEELARELLRYDPAQGPRNRQLVQRWLDIERMTDGLLQVAATVARSPGPRPSDALGLAAMLA